VQGRRGGWRGANGSYRLNYVCRAGYLDGLAIETIGRHMTGRMTRLPTEL